MKHAEITVWLDRIDGLWDNRKLSPAIRELLVERVGKMPELPLAEACEVLKRLRLQTGAFAPVEKIVAEMQLRHRQVVAGIARQESGLAANRAAYNAPVENVKAEHEAAREFVRKLSQSDMIRLRDRCLSRGSKFVRVLVSGETPDGIKPDESAKPLDWSDRDTILSRLWVCLGLWMEHNGLNDWSEPGVSA